MWKVEYRGFLQHVTRLFETREQAEKWCRQIGRIDLIARIQHMKGLTA